MVKKKEIKKENLGKYFLLGTITAVILFIVFSIFRKDKPGLDERMLHTWSPGMDSAFVKECYNKYKSQLKNDIQKQETMKNFCRCMLEKMKSKYDENEVDKMTEAEIKQWDGECRSQILNPNIQIE